MEQLFPPTKVLIKLIELRSVSQVLIKAPLLRNAEAFASAAAELVQRFRALPLVIIRPAQHGMVHGVRERAVPVARTPPSSMYDELLRVRVREVHVLAGGVVWARQRARATPLAVDRARSPSQPVHWPGKVGAHCGCGEGGGLGS